MKKLLALVICFFFMVAPAYAGPSFSAGGGGGSASLTIAADCSGYVAEGEMCWDSDGNVLYVGDGAAAAAVGPGAGAGTITNVWATAVGNVNALTAAAGDTMDATLADSTVPWVAVADCSAHTAEGRACWDTDDNILYVGDGATQVKIIKSGAIVNADIAAGAVIAYSKLAALASGNILVGSAGNVATSVTMSGDATIIASGAITIGADKILESHLKAVDAASDEDILTYESTTGDFEWHTIAEMLAKIGDTRGSVLYRGAAGWTALTPGTVSYPLVSAGAGADPAYSQIVAAGITNNTITATQLAATLSFADGDKIDLSGITQSADTNEGLILPVWANVTTTGVTNGAIAWDNASLALKVKSTGGWQSIGATAAPVDPTFLTLSGNATLTGERVLTEGTAVDFVDTGADGTLTIDFDPTELTGDRTWAAGGAAAVTWTWNNTGTDPSITFGNDLITVNNSFTVATGKTVKLGAVTWNSGDNIDGTKVANADLGDVTVTGGAWAVKDDSHAHTSTSLPANTAYTDAASQTFTGAAQSFGDADTDTLTIRSMVKGGNSREVQINAGARTAPTYPSATPTQDLYVKGNVEAAGTVYAAGFSGGTGADGSRAITMASNTAFVPSGNQIYFLNNVLKVAENGTERDVVTPADSVTWTGASHSFAAVTNLVLPTSTPDASGEIGMITGNILAWHDGAAVIKVDTTGIADGKILKWVAANGAFEVADDATAGSPALDTIGDPTSDTTIEVAATYEVNFDYTGAFTTGSQFKIEQKTGNPSGGVLFEVKGVDTDITVAKFGDGTNGVTVSALGALAAAGTGRITATDLTAQSAPVPASAGGFALGSATAEWDHLYLYDSAVIYGQDNQGNTLTSASTGWTANLLFTGSAGIAAGNGATGAGFLRLKEDSDNGTDYSTITGAADAGASPAFVFGGSAADSESLTLTMGANDNTATVSTTTGVTSLSFSALNVVTTGTISGKMPTVVENTSTTYNVTQAQAEAGTFFVNTAAGTKTFVLPAAAAGMAVCVRQGQGTATALRVDTDGTDYLVLNSTGVRTTSAGDYIEWAASNKNQFCVVAFDSTDWYVTSETAVGVEQ